MAEPNGRLAAALDCYERFGHIFPLKSKSEQYLPSWKPDPECPLDRDRVIEWWTQWPEAWLGLPLGEKTGIIRVDADGPVPQELVYDFPITPEFATPSGGHGWLFAYEPSLTIGRCVLWRGEGQHQELRYQSNGCYTVVPSSPGYRWMDGRSMAEVRVASLPRSIKDRLLSEAAAVELRAWEQRCSPTVAVPDRDQMLQALLFVPADDREVWLQVGFALHAAGDEYLDTWTEWSRKCPEKFVEGECSRLWAGFHRGGGITPRYITWIARQHGWSSPHYHEPLTDGGNAAVLARIGSGRILYCPGFGWLAWDGSRWTTGERAELMVQEVQKEVIVERKRRAITSLNRHMLSDHTAPDYAEKTRKKQRAVSRILSMDQAKHYDGARKLAASISTILRNREDFDCHPALLNFRNGTLDLKTGELRPHDPVDMLTKRIPHDYRPDAQRTEYEAFLERSLPDDGVRKYLKVKLGSTLLGETRKELLILWGPEGDNGKTKLIELMLYAMDEYAVKCSRDLLMKRRFGEDDRSTVMLIGKRFAVASETDEGARISEALTKDLTGGDSITTRHLYKEKITFLPTFSIALITNHKPVVTGTDNALWGRLKLVEWTQSFPPGHPGRVEDLLQKLKDETEGFLAWLVEGCREYLSCGRSIGEPDAVKASTGEYRMGQNHLLRFVRACFDVAEGFPRELTPEEASVYHSIEGSLATTPSTMTRLYTAWCARNREKQMDNSPFGKSVTKLGFPLTADRKHRVGLRESSQE